MDPPSQLDVRQTDKIATYYVYLLLSYTVIVSYIELYNPQKNGNKRNF